MGSLLPIAQYVNLTIYVAVLSHSVSFDWVWHAGAVCSI